MKIVCMPSQVGRGHAMRVSALMVALKQLGYHVEYGNANSVTHDGVFITDGVYPMLPLPHFRVHIADTIAQERRVKNEADLIINQNPGADFSTPPWAFKRLAGSDYFMFYDEPAPANYQAINSDYILLVPGSARAPFFAKCDLRAGMTTWGPFVILGEYREHAALLQDMKNAMLCISAASVSALESLAMGTPTMIVQTSHDQEIFTRSFPSLLYTPGRLHQFLMHGKHASLAIPRNGAERVARIIMEEYEKWHL